MKKHIFSIVILAQIMMCSGCIDLTAVQKGYVADRDECVRVAEQTVNTYLPDCTDNGNCAKDKFNVKNEDFCECMRDHGWCPVRSLVPPYPECPNVEGSICAKPAQQPSFKGNPPSAIR